MGMLVSEVQIQALEWEVVELRAKTAEGCYSITLARGEFGPIFIGRFSRLHPHTGSYLGRQFNFDMGSSPDLASVKAMCELDFAKKRG